MCVQIGKNLIYLEHGLIEPGFDTSALYHFSKNIAVSEKQDKDVKCSLKYNSSSVLYWTVTHSHHTQHAVYLSCLLWCTHWIMDYVWNMNMYFYVALHGKCNVLIQVLLMSLWLMYSYWIFKKICIWALFYAISYKTVRICLTLKKHFRNSRGNCFINPDLITLVILSPSNNSKKVHKSKA